MPAALKVESPHAPPLYQWIDAEVVRIGSSSESEVQIKGAPAHAATIVFRDGEYLLINRSDEALSLGRESLSPGASEPWPEGVPLSLPGDVSISLIRHCDPAPVVDKPWSPMPAFDAPEQHRQWLRQRRKEIVSFAVAMAALFITAVLSTLPNTKAYQAEYQAMMQTLSQAETPLLPSIVDSRGWIHKAYSQEQRSDYRRARASYLQARELLSSPENAEDGETHRKRLLSFVTSRLDALE